ncbi:MAG: hypothetical protein WD577_07010 [Bacteroidales bacterium]
MAEPTVAVLPVLNIGAVEEKKYFSDGITEKIINALSQIESLTGHHAKFRCLAYGLSSRNVIFVRIKSDHGEKEITCLPGCYN